MTWADFELTYFEDGVQDFNYYTIETSGSQRNIQNL